MLHELQRDKPMLLGFSIYALSLVEDKSQRQAIKKGILFSSC